MVWCHTTAVWCKVKLCVEEVVSHVYTNLTGINSYAGDYKHLELFLMELIQKNVSYLGSSSEKFI